MTIKRQIVTYVFSIVMVLLGGAFIFIFTLFSEYREEEFQQRQKEKIRTTLKFLTDVEEMNESITQAMDKISIHDFYDEKLLIYNENKKLIHSSLDDLPISISSLILEQLSEQNPWIETKEEQYDVIGVYLLSNGKKFYGISKAYDEFGVSKLAYLGWVLFIVYILIAIALLLVSLFIGNKISAPIIAFTQLLRSVNFDKRKTSLPSFDSQQGEIKELNQRFSELMERLESSYEFQKHAIHHISHELKTPIAVLVSNFEKIENEKDTEKLKTQLLAQKERTKSLADIINTLLEISKLETSSKAFDNEIRIDELLFDSINELSSIHPDFIFDLNYDQTVENEKNLRIKGNSKLIKSVFYNLLLNSINYNASKKTSIQLTSDNNQLIIKISNPGQLIGKEEEPFIFQHFFRGSNSKKVAGFGLGLVLVKKILDMHKAEVNYCSKDNKHNVFTIKFNQAKTN